MPLNSKQHCAGRIEYSISAVYSFDELTGSGRNMSVSNATIMKTIIASLLNDTRIFLSRVIRP